MLSVPRTMMIDGKPPLPKIFRSKHPHGICKHPVELYIRDLASAARAEFNRGPPLRCDPKLSQVALKHAQDMCQNNYTSHYSQDGRTPRDRVDAAKIVYQAVGENIASGQRSPEEVHRGWMKSPGHRENILRPEFGRIGVAVDTCREYPYWVQIFAD